MASQKEIGETYNYIAEMFRPYHKMGMLQSYR
jgi:hypothetical protein